MELPSENVLIWVTVNPTGTMHLGTEGMRWIFSFKVCRKLKTNPPTSVFVRFSVQLVLAAIGNGFCGDELKLGNKE